MENNLTDIIKKLSKPMPFKWRVQSYSKFKPQAICVSYIDSRDVQNMLDSCCEWSDRYYSENGMLFCEITILVGEVEFKRSDTGSESNVDKQKGHSSDAFKRAAVKFGVGRFLYDIPKQYINTSEKKTNSNYPYAVDDSGNKIWDITKHINSKIKPVDKPTAPSVKIDVNRLNERLTAGAVTMQGLAAVYKSFTPEEKKLTLAKKDELKAILTPKT